MEQPKNERVQRLSKTPKSVGFIVSLLLCASFFIGCIQSDPLIPQAPETYFVAEPTRLAAINYDGNLATGHEDSCISPNGKYILAAVLGGSKETMSAIVLPQDSLEAKNFEDLESVDFYSVDTSWTKNNLVQWLTVGWLSDEKCVFIVHGWQNQGEHSGDRGTAVMVGDLSQGASSLVAFIESPVQGGMVDEYVLTEAGKLIMRVSQKVWIVDINSGDKKLIYENYPNYGPLFYFAISPKGDYAVYSLNEDGRSGVFIMDLSTGEEKPLLPTGETFSFYPAWSPDGEYIMAYTAYPLNDASGQGLQLYTLIPGEDGPMPAAQSITVVDVRGNVIKTISLDENTNGPVQEDEGHKKMTPFIYNCSWLAESENLVFVSGSVALGKWGEVLSSKYTNVFIDKVTDQDSLPVNCGQLQDIEEKMGEKIDWIYPVSSLPNQQGALVNIYGKESASIWRVSLDQEAVKVIDGWWDWPRLQISYLDSTVGVVSEHSKSGLWMVSSDSAERFEEGTEDYLTVLGYNDETLVTISYDFWDNKSVIYVHSMLKEMPKE